MTAAWNLILKSFVQALSNFRIPACIGASLKFQLIDWEHFKGLAMNQTQLETLNVCRAILWPCVGLFSSNQCHFLSDIWYQIVRIPQMKEAAEVSWSNIHIHGVCFPLWKTLSHTHRMYTCVCFRNDHDRTNSKQQP